MKSESSKAEKEKGISLSFIRCGTKRRLDAHFRGARRVLGPRLTSIVTERQGIKDKEKKNGNGIVQTRCQIDAESLVIGLAAVLGIKVIGNPESQHK